jgi:hypothetical protein
MSQDDELERLRADIRSLGLIPDVDDLGRTANLPSPEQMLARAKSAEGRRASVITKRRTPWRRFAPPIIVVAAGVVAILGAMVVLPSSRDTAAADTPPVLRYEFVEAGRIAFAPGRPAKRQLLSLAKAARLARSPDSSGSSQYVRTMNWFAQVDVTSQGSSAALVPKIRELWLLADGTRISRELSGAPLSPDGRQASTKAVTSGSAAIERVSGGKGADFVNRLGPDQATVRSELLRVSGCPDTTGAVAAECLLSEIGSLATEYVMPPSVLAAFWSVLSDEESLRSLGAVEDRMRRPGVGISMVSPTAPQFRHVLIVSAQTGRVLGTEEILIKSDEKLRVHAPAIYSFTAVKVSRRTESVGPAGGDS